MAAAASVKKVWFFDDDRYNTPSKGQSKFIRFIKIEPGRHSRVAEKYNEIAIGKEDNRARSYYPNSGVKVKHLENIKKNINNIRALVFDWDKTLTLFEGVTVGTPSSGVTSLKTSLKMLKKWKILPKDWTSSKFARYLLHDSTDETRFDKLSETLQLAQSKNIPIFILTNNPMGSNQKNLFIEVFAELGVNLPIKHILRGGSKGPKGKGITIIQNIIPMIEKYEQNSAGESKHSAESKQDRRVIKSNKKPRTIQTAFNWDDRTSLLGAINKTNGGRKKRTRKKKRRRKSRRKRKTRKKGGKVDNKKLRDLKVQAKIAAALKEANDNEYSNDAIELLQSLHSTAEPEEEGLDEADLKLIGLVGGKNRKTRRKRKRRKTRKKKGGTTFYKIKVFGVTYATKYKNVPSVIDGWIDLYDLNMLKKNKKVKVARLRQIPNKNNPEESQIPPKFELNPIPKKMQQHTLKIKIKKKDNVR